ncbi:YhgE/Pip domain-containing protein [Deinococcus cellulosilyticus]|uniref:YhgE/Pip domain-containing protein n=1 Tax=Deinococcus cellulosilyticus (strain DSM 18568 / NBRC 106333 / KACC 11606 / 5516J-15) TaxID=1223518 RepID=A0A511MZ18_DEIC1|nr:YhgE/Pip domain-containing protein [Deinococcus cellulosilyticus]GEM45397.1 hypothetical protein DC3_10320 [Deinococcus cellulosilyticus NBRC 106333 = KACC 11606]
MFRKFGSDYRRVLKEELKLFGKEKKLYAAMVLISIIPTIYSATYLSSVWDPYAQTKNLPAGIVNLDRGTVFEGEKYNLGEDTLEEIRKDPPFKFREYRTTAEAQAAVEKGDIYFMVELPADLSDRAIAGRAQADLNVTVSEGSSYLAATLGKRFTNELASELNNKLSEKRWETTLKKLGTSADDIKKLKDAASKLADGAKELEDGTRKLLNGTDKLDSGLAKASNGSKALTEGANTITNGVTKLTSGVGQLSSGIHTLASKTPDQSKLKALESGAAQVKEGNSKLASSIKQMSDSVTADYPLYAPMQQSAKGAGQLAVALKQMSDQVIPENPLYEPIQQSAKGADQLSKGLKQISSQASGTPLSPSITQATGSAQQLAAGLAQMATRTPEQNPLDAPLTQLSTSAQQLAEGLQKMAAQVPEKNPLDAPLTQLEKGSNDLSKGATSLSSGVSSLTGGMQQITDALKLMDSKTPRSGDLSKLNSGIKTLRDRTAELSSGLAQLKDGADQVKDGNTDLLAGAKKLADGAKELASKIPDVEKPDARAEFLAVSFEVQEKTVNKVGNNGSAFAPYFMSLSLWMGALLTSFIFRLRVLPENVRDTSRFPKVLAKSTLPFIAVVIQGLLLALTMRLGLKLAVPNPATFYGLLLLGSMSMFGIIILLIMVLGDAGRMFAMILLVLQLASAGGAYPVELAPELFQKLHQYLPITDLVKALRAFLFGAYDSNYMLYVGRMILLGLGAFLITVLLAGRMYRYVPEHEYTPPIEA